MGADVQVSKGVNSYITSISLSAGLARKGEAGTIEDENQEHQNNNIDILKRQGQQWLCLSYCPTFESGRPEEFHLQSPSGRVEGWRGTQSPFPAPASSNAACRFPALRLLCQLHLKGYETYRPAALSSLVMPNSVIVKQFQRFVKPGHTPPVPAEATAFSRTH